jgi:hypothetical protein
LWQAGYGQRIAVHCGIIKFCITYFLEAVMTVIEQLKKEADQLSEPLAQEVLDFLLFVRQKQRPVIVPGVIERTAGAWQGEPQVRASQGDAEQRLELQ